MSSPRRARPGDVATLEALIDEAYAVYVERLGRPPSPMLDDHAGYLARGEQWVLEDEDGTIAGAVVLAPRADHLFIDNLAVAPGRQGRGLGGVLLDHAEAQARARGLPELRLHTNVVMTENQALYAHLGWEETGRETVGIYERVLFRKVLGPS
jgi:ribosomal protein S18 acetylase RimI-like enzyme